MSKWADLASDALATFGASSQKTNKADEYANPLAGEQDTSDAANVQLQQSIKSASQVNIENYQGSKKCKI